MKQSDDFSSMTQFPGAFPAKAGKVRMYKGNKEYPLTNKVLLIFKTKVLPTFSHIVVPQFLLNFTNNVIHIYY